MSIPRSHPSMLGFGRAVRRASDRALHPAGERLALPGPDAQAGAWNDFPMALPAALEATLGSCLKLERYRIECDRKPQPAPASFARHLPCAARGGGPW